MANAESGAATECLNIDFMRSLVKQYSELGQWTSALFWADTAAAASSGNGTTSGDDIWLLASALLSRGELHRAAHVVTSRGLHMRHLLCLGVAMRAYLAAKEPAAAINLIEECEPGLLEAKSTDQTHNRALAGVLVWQARALWALERREAGAAALCAALKADCACYEALELLLDHHALTPSQEKELIKSLPISNQLSPVEAELVRAAYQERLNRYETIALSPSSSDTDCPISAEVEICRSRTAEAAMCRARRLAAGCEWGAALKLLDTVDPWCCGDVRTACLVELRKSSELFAFAHSLVDAYPNSWISWYSVGCYYYLIGKNEFARRYLSKAKSLEPGAGCVWLAYGHSFASDNEHDQAMAAYFKASQLMGGCHLPPLYVGVECSLLNNVAMCERFLHRAATLHSGTESPLDKLVEQPEGGAWLRLVPLSQEPHVAHEAGVAAFAAADYSAALQLFMRALDTARADRNLNQLSSRWAPTLDALGHSCRRLGRGAEAVTWHERALAVRPRRADSLAARGLALALAGREPAAGRALHAALAHDPDHVLALALLDAIMDRVDRALAEEEVPQFPFPVVEIPTSAAPGAGAGAEAGAGGAPADADGAAPDNTNTSDMSMSFD